jgi:type II secretory pathway pseudopilin PulG
LLVVIAIIGVLSSVVLASLNSARSKGSDAAIQSDLQTVRTQAEIYYLTAGSNAYTNMCTADTTIARAVTAAENVNGSGGVKCQALGNAFLVAADLVGTSGSYYCLDSVGAAKVTVGAVSGIGAGVYACP